jgi:hypothetical protein
MYCSEYLRNKKRAAAKIISPPQGRDASEWVQMQRYKSAATIPTATQSGGQMLQLSGAAVIAAKGHASVCCPDTIKVYTKLPATCCDLVAPTMYPRNFYGSAQPECCPLNFPPPEGPCCPNLPNNSPYVIFTKRPKCRG